MNILMVDDAGYIREQAHSFLKDREDINFHEASNGFEAIEIFGKDDFDVVIIDSVMPEKSGIELIKEVLKLKPKTIVIGMTTQENGSTRKKLSEAGASRILKKPFTKDHLLEILKEYI